MRFITIVSALLPALSAVQGRQFSIPEVDEVVSRVRHDYSAYLNHLPSPGSSNVTRKGPGVSPQSAGQAYWYEQISHQGISAFGASGYQVYRNVKDYGAKGDGSTDDTAAINAALTTGGVCGQGCSSSTTQPVLVYFPAGTYMVSSPLHPAYYTQMIGNPNSVPTIKATGGFSGFGIIDADPYYTSNLNWGSTNVFMRQIRNFIIDTTAVAASSAMNGIHWPTAQATSIQNVQFSLSQGSGTQHVGLFIESGSAGVLTDLTFTGGLKGAALGNQQVTTESVTDQIHEQYLVRNLVFNNCGTAISMFWDWSFAMKSISINNCGTGIDMSAGGSSGQTVGSITLYDSSISNTNVGIATAWTTGSSPATGGALVLENVQLSNVGTAVTGPNGATNLGGGSTTISAYFQGHEYTPNGPTNSHGSFTPVNRPGSLLSGSKYYEASKPQFEDLDVSSFVSARSSGATGNGNTDDTNALQNGINSATSAGKVFYIDAGTYKVTNTITIPPGAKIVGEAYPVIMSSGSVFNNVNNPVPVVRVGNSGQTGTVQWTDSIVATQGAQAGAILIEWNLASSGTPSGMWDVHTRIGGFAGSNLQVAQCPTSASASPNCMGAFMSMHVTKSASNLYLENVWLWTADHDIDSSSNTQISVYSGRGLLIESTSGTIWLSGTGVEHHVFYNYQFSGTQNIYMGQAQTETPYYQPNPSAPAPFTYQSSWNDPNFAQSCSGQSGNCANSWGLRAVNTNGLSIYGAGFYSFFNSYSTSCSNGGGAENCQNNIVSLENCQSTTIYNLNTVGTTNMLTVNGQTIAKYSDNVNSYTTSLALFKQ